MVLVLIMLPVKSINEYKSNKIISFKKAIDIIKRLKSKGKKAGLCHGSFDLLHAGHVKHFESGKKLCDVLFASITSDNFVEKRKGHGRPIFNEKLRAYMIAAIKFVDYVVISDFNLGVEVIRTLKPSYYIKGIDYENKKDKEIEAERDAISYVRGQIKYTKEPKMSTTEIMRYIKDNTD